MGFWFVGVSLCWDENVRKVVGQNQFLPIINMGKILKFSDLKCQGIVDITDDPRTKLIPLGLMIRPQYRIAPGIFMVRNGLMLRMARIRGNREIQALYIRKGDSQVIVIDEKSYVFWEGRSIEPQRLGLSLSHVEEQVKA